MNLEKAVSNLEKRGFTVRVFEDRKAAADYLTEQLEGRVIGIGGSTTVKELDVYDRLCEKNTVYWNYMPTDDMNALLRNSMNAEVYISSVNAAAETGELINIDSRGNRVAATLYGPSLVYLVLGENKFAEDFDKALWRARNIASPKNAQKLGKKTPCALKADRCYDCSSPDRICNGLVVFWGKMKGTERTEVLIVREALGL